MYQLEGGNVIMADFGAGFAVGIAVGIAVGVGAGNQSAYKKREKQLRKAISDNELSIRDKNGEPLTVDDFFELLD